MYLSAAKDRKFVSTWLEREGGKQLLAFGDWCDLTCRATVNLNIPI